MLKSKIRLLKDAIVLINITVAKKCHGLYEWSLTITYVSLKSMSTRFQNKMSTLQMIFQIFKY